MIVVVAALKGGVGKTTTSVYLSAVAVTGKRTVTLVDADPQASGADWIEHAADEVLESVDVVEAPTERLLTKVLEKVDADDVAVVDTPPGPRAAPRQGARAGRRRRHSHPGRWCGDRPGRGGARHGAEAVAGRAGHRVGPHLHP